MRPSGTAMVEALVAAGLLALGLLGASRLTLRALDAAQQTRHHAQAQALAREALDCALAQSWIASLQPCPAAESVTWQGMTYTVQLQQRPIGPFLTDIAVQVNWRTHSGAQSLNWQTRRSDLPDWLGVSSP